ncbi:MAG TPA: tetratricopeptide repeat protein [Chthoniobacteraceae bacterium]|nr:tetratricopeptide repeat protein [Chthoniobacteraceae bacterium]
MFYFGAILLALTPCATSNAQDASWLVRDAPFRVGVKLKQAPRIADAGIAIELPDFGQSRQDLADALLVDDKGQMQPLAAAWHGQGQRALLLAKDLKPGVAYQLYYGGNAARTLQAQSWAPKLSLFMETRRLPEGARFETWQDMQQAWNSATKVDGAGFVGTIYEAGNPFGDSANFVTHYTGYLQTTGLKDTVLYTLSSDASFVCVNDAFEFAWPGFHSPKADANTVHSKKMTFSQDWTKIDYYAEKYGANEPATVLGWDQGGKLQAIPPQAWLHPGAAQTDTIVEAHGWPVPIVKVENNSYIGYAFQWYYDVKFSIPGAKLDGWNVQWQFEDGAICTGPECQRVITNPQRQFVTVTLQRGTDQVKGVKEIDFPDSIPADSINTPADVVHYLDLLSHEPAALLSRDALAGGLVFLRDFGTDEQIASFADAWLKKGPASDEPLWLPAQLARLRAMARTNPQAAVTDLRSLDPQARNRYAKQFSMLEINILVFYLHDPSVVDLAKRIEFQYPKSDIAQFAEVRTGDFYRLTDHYPEAVAQYEEVQKAITDESAGRKLPSEDQAYSITIKDLITRNLRSDASNKLDEWELKHPMAKFNSDFLLLRGRMLLAFGRWNEALSELESFKKVQHDSPSVIDADFYRAQALDGLGKKDEARKIWNEIATDYPKHELAAQCKALAAKP